MKKELKYCRDCKYATSGTDINICCTHPEWQTETLEHAATRTVGYPRTIFLRAFGNLCGRDARGFEPK